MQRLSLCQISGITQKGGRFHSGAFVMENIIFKPDKYYNLSEYVMLPVNIKAYIKRNNQSSNTICTRKDYQTRGEAF